MTIDFLAWFLAQKPYRKSRLVMKNGFERFIDNPEQVKFVDVNKIQVIQNPGMHGVIVDLDDVVEIKQ